MNLRVINWIKARVGVDFFRHNYIGVRNTLEIHEKNTDRPDLKSFVVDTTPHPSPRDNQDHTLLECP